MHCGKMIHPTAKVSEQVNRKCPQEHNLTTFNPYTDPIRQTPDLLHHSRCCCLANELKSYLRLMPNQWQQRLPGRTVKKITPERQTVSK